MLGGNVTRALYSDTQMTACRCMISMPFALVISALTETSSARTKGLCYQQKICFEGFSLRLDTLPSLYCTYIPHFSLRLDTLPSLYCTYIPHFSLRYYKENRVSSRAILIPIPVLTTPIHLMKMQQNATSDELLHIRFPVNRAITAELISTHFS
jgi:hypothetical protein